MGSTLTTASREELETEVAERRRVEEALRESNQTLEALIQASPLAVIVHDPDANVQMWNPAAERIFGWSEQEVLGHPYPLVPEDKQDEFRADLERSLGGEALTGQETRRQSKDGTIIDVGIWTGPLGDGGAIVIVADVTDRKRAEEVLLQQMQELAVLDERNRLAREIHDSLAQGFTAIIWQANAAERTVEGGGKQASQSLERVRDLAREGLVEARRSVWDLRVGPLEGRTLSEVLQQETEKVTKGGDIQTSFDLSGEERVLPSGVEAAILRICQESLANVLKHANATQMTVTLAFHDSQVRLAIRDNGVGFDPATPRTPDRVRGGFGLINMRERARLLGGELTAHSEPGQGTLVEATLPL
jgi:PAS domain S-box-containing protein